jgi:aminopeptidase N
VAGAAQEAWRRAVTIDAPRKRRVTRSKKKTTPVIDPYLPANGNFGYRVSRYELDLEYKVAVNRLTGTATITAVTLAALRSFTLDLSDALSVSKVSLNDVRPQQFRSSTGKLHITLRDALPAGAAMTVVVRYGGNPRPVRSLWGDVGFEELTEGALVAGQPNGAKSWFPCDDHPSAKASYRIRIAAESPYRVIANGELVSRRARAGMTTWTYDLPEPTSTYLVTLQIGVYERHRLAKNGVPIHAVLPHRLRDNFDRDFADQPKMMKLFVKMFGPYPLAEGYSVVVTDDDLEIPLEAQGISIFGANHCDGEGSAERLIAHELAHQWFGNSVTAKRWRHIWLHEGFACYAEWLWSEHSGGRSADEWARHYHQRLAGSPQDLLLADPGPEDMFDDRVYKRGALTLHMLRQRIGNDNFFALLRDWTTRHRHGTVVTDDFTGLASNYAHDSLRSLWDAWLYSTDLPALDPPP